GCQRRMPARGMTKPGNVSRELPRVSIASPVLWFRYFTRFFASFVPPSSIKSAMYGLTGISVGPKVFIGEGVYIVDGFQSGLVVLEREAVLSPKSILVAMAMPGDSFLAREYEVTSTGRIVIGEGAWIGAGAVVLPGVTIGRGAIVGANAVVTRPIGELEVWAGNPARFIKRVEDFGRRC
ncbi:MAG TPA: acyltransferase, partial [Vicinamibacterales bacterium]|nr:acyltransferase [Vicinamibacterales bacterium]